MAKTRETRDLRSLERASMYSIFAPLDPDERLPRELIEEKRPPIGIALLAGFPRKFRRRELAAGLFVPALFLLLAVAGVAKLNGQITFVAAALLVAGFIAFAATDKR